MKQLFKDEKAENPIEVGFYVIIVILVMAYLMTTVGAFLDEFNTVVLTQNSSLSSWGQGVLSTYLNYINWTYRIPIIFIIIVMIWGVRAVIRKHTYTSANQTYMNPEEDI